MFGWRPRGEPLWDNGTDNSNDHMDYSGRNTSGRRIDPLNEPDLTVIGSYIPFTEGKGLVRKVGDLITALDEDVSNSVTTTGVKRFAPKYRNKPGLVKISFQSLDLKMLVLRNKRKLRDIIVYKRVFLKSCKTHAERLIELNARAILKELPRGKSFRVEANSKIKTRSVAHEATPGNTGNQNIDEESPQHNDTIAHVNVCGWTNDNHALLIKAVNAEITCISEMHLPNHNLARF